MKSGCLCLCGCGEETNIHKGKPNRYINGHNWRGHHTIMTPEQILKFSIAHKGQITWNKGKHWPEGKHPMLGKHRTEESKELIRRINTENPSNPLGINQYTKTLSVDIN